MRPLRETREALSLRSTATPSVAAPIAVIGSPNSTTHFTVDILETARDRALDHAWVVFDVAERFNGKVYRKRALCQMGGIVTRNRWHEDPVIRAVIKRQGALPALSGESDLTAAQLSALGVFLLDEQGAWCVAPPSRPRRRRGRWFIRRMLLLCRTWCIPSRGFSTPGSRRGMGCRRR